MRNLLAEFRTTKSAPVLSIVTLADAHNTLDAAVAAVYGWVWPLREDEVLTRLLDLNPECAAHEEAAAQLESIPV